MVKEKRSYPRIEEHLEQHNIVLFMKGSKEAPQCGFSAKVVNILEDLVDDFCSVDVLRDSQLREDIKHFSDWPTIPQLYVKGEFVGGCDIIVEMTLSGELDTLFSDNSISFDKAAAKRIREENK